MQPERLERAMSHQKAGFRLHRFEVYNWGTFHQRVWMLTPGGENSLLTGDIGSGKSTLVDAVTTLLVPPQRITYNKAAGAEAKERSLRSYVLGYYKSERSEGSLVTKPVSLRDQTSYSVILAHFHNEGYHLDVTLAQVFWLPDPQEPPSRLYVIADRPLSIAADFSGFGSDIADLRKRLRASPGVRLYDHFPPYAADFRRRFGIESDQALHLFHQTVSMKSVGNLTEFVQTHMLEAFPVEERIEALLRHFDDLDRAHEAVLKAKEQIAALEPLVADLDRLDEVLARLREQRSYRDALNPWFASLKEELLLDRIERLDHELERLNLRLRRLEERRRQQQAKRDELRQAIAENGGDRLARLETEIQRLRREEQERRRQAEAYRALALALGLDDVTDEDGFFANRRAAGRELAVLEDRQAEMQNALTEASVMLRDLRQERETVEKELASLRGRRSNIPSRMLVLRERLSQALGVAEEELPFAGELIQVREEEAEWEGAIERLLRSFGLSLLVPDHLYPAVAAWVDRTHLGGRLVYFRVRPSSRAESGTPVRELLPHSLVHKVAVRPDSPFFGWLEAELARRFDYACCTDMDQFRREQRAITPAGQIKGGERHEKDDRYSIADRSRYVLGWNNEAKIAALEKQARDLATRGQAAAQQVAKAQAELRRLQERRAAIIRLQAYERFETLDWRSLVVEIQRLTEEHAALASASDRLRALQDELERLEQEMAQTDREMDSVRDERGTRKERRRQAAENLARVRKLLETTPDHVKELFSQLAAMRSVALGEVKLTVESCETRESEMRQWLQGRIDAEEKRHVRLRERVIDAMRLYQSRWPSETREVDVNVEAAGEYRAMLERLQADDLPRFEARFRELLRENTIREVAAFQAQLNREREAIRDRIETINRSLQSIDYNPGRYITLLAEPTNDPEVREFRESLRACTEGTLTGSEQDQYSEAKFLQVKAIIDRFRGREGLTDLDRRWTRKVTDVRNWFVFSASERWREDDTEYEHYTDSGGKSGGQKEKLAYTVLAASLAYQFGLEWGEERSRSFRFVVIDEAFGRGSDESARYGLELFKRLNLQVLVVTPLQKIHVIEPYVSSVAFVHNEGGRQSMVRNLTIEEYRAEKAARGWVRVS